MIENVWNTIDNKFIPSRKYEQLENIPVGTYVIKSTIEGFYLEQVSNFEAPAKYYGSILSDSERILNTYSDRISNTAVLLSGEKGAGKTLTAKTISLMGLELGMITILVNQPFTGDAFNTFLQRITQPCILFFDEFEKVYSAEDQTQLLTLLDGVYTDRKLFLITINNYSKIDSHLENRPGRVFYFKEYLGLSSEFVVEYCEDNLHNKENIRGAAFLTTLIPRFNFDMLKGLVEEMNRYNETAQEACKYLNIRIPTNQDIFDLKLFVDGHEHNVFEPKAVYRHPLTLPLIQTTVFDETLEDVDYDSGKTYVFTTKDIVEANLKESSFEFQQGNANLTATRRKQEVSYSFADPSFAFDYTM